jgi:chromosome segregation ATPase
MVKKLVLCIPVLATALLLGCESKEKDQLQSKVDSLQTELEASQKMARTLTEVGVLMDSIDASRQLLRVNMVEGTTYEDYKARMNDINNYVKDTQRKIEEMEKTLSKSKSTSNSYAKTIKQLRADLAERTKTIADLQEQVDKYRNENQNLVSTVSMQEAELVDKQAEIEAKGQELALIEARIQELMLQSKMSEADAYYARAQAVEEAANRTKLAPKKKKETLREAMELYKKSLSMGKTEAQEKIDDLEKRI